ncbi:phage head closure protein [Breoghania sp. L-A4]|uniref:phage head closure protein n=1 Tax=Breoghania sp. L-A4 TaxID=2304600 RepID=UPI000E358EB0|nr:phage head closure protein [Breoghania sp. L-A4]AXS39962.1 head-tail adaptor protein [Breoghania sp. L-A4]
MSAGHKAGIADLRARVALQAPQESDDGSGGVTVAWADVATVWAFVEPQSAREQAVSGHLDGVVTHAVILRYRDDVRGGWRIVSGEQIFRVLATHDLDGRARRLLCRCEEERR